MPIESVFDERPTREGLSSLIEHLSSVWSRAHAQWREAESFYWNDYTVFPLARHSNRSVSRPSTPSFYVDRATDTQMAYHPSVHRRRNRNTIQAEAEADKAEPFLAQSIIRAMRKENPHTGRQLAHHLNTLGYAILEGPQLDFTNYVIEPKREQFPDNSAGTEDFELALKLWEAGREDWSPFILRAPHPASVLLDYREKQPTFAIKLGKHFAGDIFYEVQKRKRRRLRNLANFGVPAKAFEELETVEFFNTRFHALALKDGEILFVEPNTLGFVPFVQVFAGYGFERMDGGLDPANLAMGLLSHKGVQDDIRRQAQAISASHNILMNKAYTPMGTTGNAAELAEKLSQDGILDGMERDDVWHLQFPDVGADMFNYIQLLGRFIEQGIFSLTAAGFRETGVKTLGEQEILSRATNLKFVSPQEAMNDAFSIAGSNILRLVDYITRPAEKGGLGEQKVMVGGYELSSGDIGGRYSVDVAFEVVDPQLRLAEKQVALTEFQSGLRSKRSYMEVAGIANATEEFLRLGQDLLDKHPATVTAMMAEAARHAGMMKLAEGMQAESERLQEQSIQETEEFASGQVAGNGTSRQAR